MHRICISYNSGDKRFAIELQKRLQFYGAKVWIDISEMRAGDSIIRTLSEAIVRTTYFIVILTPASVNSHWVVEELEQALTRQVAGNSRFVIPLLYKQCEVPHYLKKLRYIDFTKPRKRRESFIDLFRSLSLIDHRHAPSSSSPASSLRKDFFSELRSKSKIKRTDKEIVDTPGAAILFNAVKFQMYGGLVGREIISLLSLFSHIPIWSQHWFQLMTAMIFDIMTVTKTPPRDAIRLVSAIVSCQSVHTAYRNFAGTLFFDMLRKIEDREFVISAIPDIFIRQRHDPLADDIIGSFMSSSAFDPKSLLEQFWSFGTADQRMRIEAYVRNNSTWKETPMEGAYSQFTDSLEKLCVSWKRNWIGSWRDDNSDKRLNVELKEATRHTFSSMESIVYFLERSVALVNKGNGDDIVTFVTSLQNKTVAKLKSELGDAWQAHLILNLIASPYMPQEVCVSLYMLNVEVVQEVMQMDGRFPDCLFRSKEISWRTDKSFIGVCCETALGREQMSDIAALMLISIIGNFDNDIMKMAIDKGLEEHPRAL